MPETLRGADSVMRALERQGVTRIAALSGNHIMSLFDAALGRPVDLVHVRHEAAAVHMADAWGRLTGEPGVAMVTGGPGHANAAGALFTALGAESPMVLLSGHACTWEIGRGGFQELDQVAMAAPVSKASWLARSAATLADDVARAFDIARSGRPGPVHLSLPSDLLDEVMASPGAPAQPQHQPGTPLADGIADAVLAAIKAADRPVILAGPHLSSREGRTMLAQLEQATGAPAVVLESPRGIADATIGAFSGVLARADLILLLGKALDFTVRWLEPPLAGKAAKVITLDPDPSLVARASRELGGRLLTGTVAETVPAIRTLLSRARLHKPRASDWLGHARAAIDQRPRAWASLTSATPARLHPAEVFRALGPIVARDPNTILVCDGGEFSQWGQALLTAPRRIVNSVTGSIGAGLSFALAARMHDREAPVFAVIGDGTFGFHMSEIETAVRRDLAVVVIVGNDACWNAESQIQRRTYGEARMHGCDLLPARYDLVATALGGHGELVTVASQLEVAIVRAVASGKAAVVNVMTEAIAAPVA